MRFAVVPEWLRLLAALTLVLSGPGITSAQVGQALTLDGAGSYASVPSSPLLQNPEAMTVEAWIRPDVLHNGRVLSKGDGVSGETSRSYDLTYAEGHLRIEWFLTPASDGYVPLETATVQPPSEWVHVAAVFDGAAGLASLYVDGELAQARTTTVLGAALTGKTVRQTSYPLNLGATPPFGSTFFRGLIEEVRIWSVARSQTEIQTDRCLDLDGTSGLVAAWHFDGNLLDSTGSHDASPQGNAGIVAYSESRCDPTGPRVLHVPAEYATIQAALDAALNGDEILVASGTYFERLVFLPKAVRLHSESGPEETVIDGLQMGGSVVHLCARHDSQSGGASPLETRLQESKRTARCRPRGRGRKKRVANSRADEQEADTRRDRPWRAGK